MGDASEFGSTENSPKYVVFKTEDLFLMLGKVALPPWTSPDGTERVGESWDCAGIAQELTQEVADRKLDDAVVIRLQDRFAGAALHAYATTIANAVDVLEDVWTKGDTQDCTEEEGVQLGNLRGVRDKFFEFALSADDYAHKKLPS